MTKAAPESVVVALSARAKLSRLSGLILEEQGHHVKYAHVLVSDKVKAVFGWEQPVAALEAWVKQSGKDFHKIDLTAEADAWLESEAHRALGQFWSGDLRGLFDSEFLLPRLVAWARSQGATKVSTGHRCRVSMESEKEFSLWRSRDIEHDQSAWIAQKGRKLFPYLNLPLGYLKVTEIEKLCVKHEISREGEKLADESERSADLSRLPDLVDTKALSRVKQRGYIIDETQKVLGEHAGLLRHRLGSRMGLEEMKTVPETFVPLGYDLMKQWLVVAPATKAEAASACLTARAEWCVSKPKLFGHAETFDIQIGFKDPLQGKARVKLLADSMLRLEKNSDADRFPHPCGRRVTLYRGALCLGSAQVLESYL
jgi:tRNA-specific 2-thiouridylase